MTAKCHMSATSDVKSPQAVPSEEFIEGVKQVLEHLYDLAYLHGHVLRQTLLTNQEQVDTSPAQQLQRLLINAVESLNPGNDVAFRAPSARIYNLLHLHYVEDMTVQEAANELGISTRQAYRDLRQGEKSTATILWTQRSALSPEPRALQLSSVESEMEQFEYHLQAIDLCLLLTEAQKSVENLASSMGNQFVLVMPDTPLPVWTDSVVAQQVLTNLLSKLVQQLRHREIHLEVTDRHGGAMLNLSVSTQFSEYDKNGLLGSAGWQLAERLGWTIEQRTERPGRL